ncbi:MAG: hypothetical protein K6G76_12470 [Lachnospiraceae bacterium]|nr:hypothetical protein [Lachnospiraceae bacterium]
MKQNNKKMVLCENCGAEFDVSLVRCPYCGSGYAPAEEDEYMDKMEDIRTELESHTDDADEKLKKGIGKTLLVGIIMLVVIASLLLGGLSLFRKSERNKGEQEKQEFLQSIEAK